MDYIKLLWFFSLFTMDIQASTHWVVTETGLIQPKIDSPFEMARPYDLLAFLNQDTRWDNIIKLYHDLTKRQSTIDKYWSELIQNTDITAHLAEDENCIITGPLTDLQWYSPFMDDGMTKNVPPHEYMLKNLNYGVTDVPNCKKISSLTFSMFAFEHLEGVIKRENLTIKPELSLPEQIIPIMTVDQFGHWLATVLKKNSSSWLHYNMASLFWRIKGHAAKAIECSRRAIHYAPRQYKDIALQSLGSVLHRSNMIEDSIIVLGAAVDHNPMCYMNQFVLACAYAVIGDFNSSIRHLDVTYKLNPSFDFVKRHKTAALCYTHLLQKIKDVAKSLKNLRDELVMYSNREAHWLKSQAAFLRTMKHKQEFDYRDVDNNCQKMTELTGLNIVDLKKSGDKNSLIQYFLDSSMYNEEWLKEKGIHLIESAINMQRLVQHIQQHADMVADFVMQDDHLNFIDTEILKEIGPMPTALDENSYVPVKEQEYIKEMTSESPTTVKKYRASDDITQFETGVILYPPSMKVSRNIQDFDKDAEWPTSKQCKENAPTFPENVEAIFPVFMPFENKGIRLGPLLTDSIGAPAAAEHELPWHPPVCPNDKDAAPYTQKKSQKPQFVNDVVQTGYLKEKLMEYVTNGKGDDLRQIQDAEIGQRIYSAMQKKLAPKWLLYTLSSLYWRVRGNNGHALNCLVGAAKSVDSKYRDVVLASLASVYLEMGHFDEALSAAEEAFRLSHYEPATNFILAELNMVKKHRNTHMFHLKQVVRVESGFMHGLARGLLYGWACILRQLNDLHEIDFGEGDVCTQVEPGMVCDKDGDNCHVATIQCFTNKERNTV